MKLEIEEHKKLAKAIKDFTQKLKETKAFEKKNSHEREIYLHLSWAIWLLQDYTFLEAICDTETDVYNPDKLGFGRDIESELQKLWADRHKFVLEYKRKLENEIEK